MNIGIKQIIVGIGVFLAFILVINCYTVVSTGEEASVTSFGEVKEGKNLEGFNFVAPWWDIDEYNLQDRTWWYDDIGVASQDKFKTQMDVAYTGSFIRGYADKTRKNTGTSSKYLETHVNRRVLSCITKAGGDVKNSQAFFEKTIQEQVSNYTLNCVNEYLSTVGGFKLKSVQISDIRLDPQVKKFMVDTKRRQEEENQAKSELQIAETLAQKVVKTSEANLLAAENDKEARKLGADAAYYEKQQEAAGNIELNKSITGELIKYVEANRWNGSKATTILGDQSKVINQIK